MPISQDSAKALKNTVSSFKANKDRLQSELASLNIDIVNLTTRRTNVSALIDEINVAIDAIKKDLSDGGIT